MKTLLSHITNAGLVYDEEVECYAINTAPFTTLSVVFNAGLGDVDDVGNTLILLNDVDGDGNWFDWSEEFTPEDNENAIIFFDKMFSEMTRCDTSQVTRGVGAQKALEKMNDIAGDERFSFIM